MRTLNRSRPHTTTTNGAGHGSVGGHQMPARRLSPQLIADAVMVSYIHEISHGSRRSSRAPNKHLSDPRPNAGGSRNPPIPAPAPRSDPDEGGLAVRRR
jgi:hypothetical protein